MKTIRHLFVDTNALHQSWPVLSVTLENIFNAAKSLGVAVELPHAVLVEAKRNWRERTKKEFDNTKQNLRRLDRLLGQTNLGDVLPEWDAIEQAHEVAIAKLLSDCEIAVTPLPTDALAELFIQATEQSLVFGSKGSNFQDAVIFHSIVTRLAKCPGEHAALISDDGIFLSRWSQCEEFANAKSVSLELLTLAEAKKRFTDLLEDEPKRKLAMRRDLALTAVTSFLPAAEKLFNEQLEWQARRNAEIKQRDIILRNARFQKIVDVDASDDYADLDGTREARISVIVDGTVEPVQLIPTRGTTLRVELGEPPKFLEVGFTARAKVVDGRYSDLIVEGFSYGWPSQPGSVGHPQFDIDQSQRD